MAATAGAAGTKTGGTFTYDPYGQPLSGYPQNTASNVSYGWVGGKQKLTEHQGSIATVEMGARQYVPGLGRFLSVDPIEGGCANHYVYVSGDPLRESDLTGRGALDFLKKLGCVATTLLEDLGEAATVLQKHDLSEATSLVGVGTGVYVVGAIGVDVAASGALGAGLIAGAVTVGAPVVAAGGVLIALYGVGSSFGRCFERPQGPRGGAW